MSSQGSVPRRSPAGSVLPSEAELSEEFGASRVTVRRALDLVREDGLIAARQGFGWYVATEPVRQRLNSLGTIEAQLAAGGRANERRIIEFAFDAPPPRVGELLGVDSVLRVKRVNLADGEPFAVVTVWCPADAGAGLSRRDVERHPFYELLDVRLRGATQTIGADAAGRRRRPLLGVPGGRTAAHVPAGHHRRARPPGAGERARVPGPPHRVRGRAALRRAVDQPERPAPGRVARRVTTCPSAAPCRAARAWPA